MRAFSLSLVALSLLAACSGELPKLVGLFVPPAEAQPVEMAMRWDHVEGSEAWTEATLAALHGHGAALLTTVPADIEDWCPGYAAQDAVGRSAFWAGLISTLAKHESTWNPRAVGGGGRWFGLVQIAPSTARYRHCEAKSGAALKEGVANLSCAVRIMAVTVPRDGVVSRGMRGVAADWGPFHSARKREDMRAWIRAQSYCAP
ncbi:MAG: lytic transglycosylase [Rhodobacterales bacterium]|nr:MAG: lytic transglycosylase [Rhodobacterales bacterium]